MVKNGFARDGKRASDPKRYLKDAELLEEEHRSDPCNARTVFYLAQSYVTADVKPLALKYYQLRSEMGGLKDEVFWSLYYAALIQEDLDLEKDTVIQSYVRAYEFNKDRAEPLCSLSRYLMKKKNAPLAYLAAKAAVKIPQPQTQYYVKRDVYDYESLLYLAYSAHLIGQFDEALIAYRELLEKKLPENIRNSVDQFLIRCRQQELIYT